MSREGGPGSCGCGSTLTPEQRRILLEHGTERPGSSPLNDEKRSGLYLCAGCGRSLFSSESKYDSGSGWPSFYDALKDGIETTEDKRFGMLRTEVHCAGCHGHLGHVFPDGPPPTGLRYCMNGLALNFIHDDEGANQ